MNGGKVGQQEGKKVPAPAGVNEVAKRPADPRVQGWTDFKG